MNAIDQQFERLRQAGEKAFIPFIAAGDPDLATTGKLLTELDSLGSHFIEVGVPFSDPIADGPVIQAAYTRALERGVKVEEVFACLESAQGLRAPRVMMASYSLIWRRGVEAFLDRAVKARISGAVVPDLPVEEAAGFARLAADRQFHLIMLVTPTTPPARAEKIVKVSSGFVYVVSVAGITGERDRLPPELLDQLRRLRTMTNLPLCVGFGVSRPDHVKMLREEADGVIVGSALVRRLEKAGANWDLARTEIRDLVKALLAALNPAASGKR